MAYQALYRSFRPKTFGELIGQDHIVSTLENQVRSGHVGHAYLLVGSRGTGKTSTAKIFAKAINCLCNQNGSPCGVCEACKALENPNTMDVLEIDGASNNKVEEARALREKVKYPPVLVRKKVFIIDEVHMLTDSAFNALLKTIEEPPENVVFILATTEVHKIPATILSRCLRLDFHLVGVPTLTAHLKKVLKTINVDCDEDAALAIALAGNGSVRDMLSVAEAVVASSDGHITLEKVNDIVGMSDFDSVHSLVQNILTQQTGKALTAVLQHVQSGKNILALSKELCIHFQRLLIFSSCENPEQIVPLTSDKVEKMKEQSSIVSTKKLTELLEKFAEVENSIKVSLSPDVFLSAAVVSATIDGKKND